MTGFHFLCTVYRYIFVAFFLHDISTREQFPFMVYCYRVKAIFHNLAYALLYWRLCGLTYIAPLLNTLQLRLMCMESRRLILSNTGFRMANCFCCLTKCHGVPCSLPSRITTKVLKNCKTFFKTNTKTFIFVLEAPRDQDPGLEDITGYDSDDISMKIRSVVFM